MDVVILKRGFKIKMLKLNFLLFFVIFREMYFVSYIEVMECKYMVKDVIVCCFIKRGN